MRLLGVLVGTLILACLHPPQAEGQNGEPHRGEPQLLPYHQHHDTRHGHDHFYPDRGAIVRDAPKGASVVTYAGLAYRFADGIWFEPRGPAFMVVAPPIGVVVPALPPFATVLAQGGELYLYANDVYYRPRPDLNGYEVVDDPAEPPLSAEPDEAVGPQPLGAHDRSPRAAARTSASPGATTGASAAQQIPLPAAVAVAASASAPTAATTPAAIPAPGPVASAASPPSAAAPAPSDATLANKAAVAPTPAASTPATGTGTPGASGASAPGAAATEPAAPVANAPVPPPAVAASVAAPTPTVPAANPPGTTAVSVVDATAPASSPAGSASAASSGAPRGTRVVLAPRNGQTPDQEARDRYDCYRFAVTQTGFDPLRYRTPSASNGESQSEYGRVQAACFEARGYSVR